jgi:chemotaxis protein methyltransferase CheR
VDAYFARLQTSVSARGELRAIVGALTVGETFFLRNAAQLDAFAALVRSSPTAGTRRTRVLSAGCASGEEPYSIAIMALERFPELAPLLEIQAVDANVASLEKANAGRYSSWSMRETPAALVRRYFVPDGRELVLRDEVRRMVTFAERNLAEDDPTFWSAGAFDVVFCRNVSMYFSEVATRALVGRFARAIPPGGYLFLGHAESLRGVSTDFDLRHTHETFYYRRCDARSASLPIADSATAIDEPRPRPAGMLLEPAPLALEPTGWMEAIQRSADHIEQLARERNDGSRPTTQPRASPAEGFDGIVALLRAERFADAIARIRALPASATADPTAQTLLGVALTNSGQVSEARDVCECLLRREPEDVGVHFLLALCAELAGDNDASVLHARTASALDPEFAMPHLHLGLLARRAGNTVMAEAELRRALVLLRQEDEARIILFGGGFRREALLRLCEAELRAIGGALSV